MCIHTYIQTLMHRYIQYIYKVLCRVNVTVNQWVELEEAVDCQGANLLWPENKQQEMRAVDGNREDLPVVWVSTSRMRQEEEEEARLYFFFVSRTCKLFPLYLSHPIHGMSHVITCCALVHLHSTEVVYPQEISLKTSAPWSEVAQA